MRTEKQRRMETEAEIWMCGGKRRQSGWCPPTLLWERCTDDSQRHERLLMRRDGWAGYQGEENTSVTVAAEKKDAAWTQHIEAFRRIRGFRISVSRKQSNAGEAPPLSVGPPAPGQILCVNESKGQRGHTEECSHSHNETDRQQLTGRLGRLAGF